MGDYEEEKKKKGQQITDSFNSALDSGRAWENFKSAIGIGEKSASKILNAKKKNKNKDEED